MVCALATFMELTHVYKMNTYNNNNYIVWESEYKIREFILLWWLMLFGKNRVSKTKQKKNEEDASTEHTVQSTFGFHMYDHQHITFFVLHPSI